MNRRAAAAAVPVVLVNAVAFAGQLAFLRGHLPFPLPGQVLVAVTLESVAVYLAYHAHVALVADDSSLRLRLASYAFALVIAVMNYSHYAAPGWRPTFGAVAFALMSASSPWLWAVHSRRQSRDALKARGLIEPHALRLGPTRWSWHPLRSAHVMWLATWEGITDPREAVTRWEATRPRAVPVVYPDGAEPGGPGPAVEPGLERLWAWLTSDGNAVPAVPVALNGHAHAAAQMFAADLAQGRVPGIRAIRSGLHVGQDKATHLQAYLRTVACTPEHPDGS